MNQWWGWCNYTSFFTQDPGENISQKHCSSVQVFISNLKVDAFVAAVTKNARESMLMLTIGNGNLTHLGVYQVSFWMRRINQRFDRTQI